MLLSRDTNVVREISGVLTVQLFISLICFILYEFVIHNKFMYTLSLIAFLTLVFSVYFFRDPDRKTPDGPGLVISPADGKLIEIKEIEHDYFGKKVQKVSIFMSVMNVHINRAPIAGEIEHYEYNKGKFFNASFDKASEENEQNFLVIKGKEITIGVKQIAGLIARRIGYWKPVGTSVERGEKFGLIRYGSRLEVFLPENVKVDQSLLGKMVKAGETILGEVQNDQ